MSLNLTNFVAELAAKTGLSKKAAKEVLGVVFQLIMDTVKKGGEVRIQGKDSVLSKLTKEKLEKVLTHKNHLKKSKSQL